MSDIIYADVIIDIIHEKVDKPFTYIIPNNLRDIVVVGTPVVVPFGKGNKERVAYVIGIKSHTPYHEKIKSIIRIADRIVTAENSLITLATMISHRYGCTLSKALKTVLPIKKKVKARKEYALSDADYYKDKKNIRLNDEQSDITNQFSKEYDEDIRKTYLLFGITGSGKTEVYIEMIRHVISKGKSAIVLVPEIGLTYQTVGRIASAFGDRVVVIHSKQTGGEKYDQFEKVQKGEADIVVGPRSAIFAPLKNIGLIIIDEEHDASYKNETVPRYDTRDIAKMVCDIHHASLILASATPSLESYTLYKLGIYELLRLDKRAVEGARLAQTTIVDLREELRRGNRSIFSSRLSAMIQERLKRKEQVILFINRRGYANFVSCRSCGNAIKCPHCDVTLTLHADGNLRCHYCGYKMISPKKCPDCGSENISGFGLGTQKLENMTKKMFPLARVARLDADSQSREILDSFKTHNSDILIGTQMVVKGHDIPSVTLVGIMAADLSLYVGHYDAAERTYELITQASGRAGRGDSIGDVVIQTYRPDHYAIRYAASGDYEKYYETEMHYRKLASYPPYVHICTIQIASKDEEKAIDISIKYSNIIKKIIEQYDASMSGPIDAQVYKVNDYYRKMIYIKHTSYDILLRIKEESEAKADKESLLIDISILYDFA